MFVSLIYGQDTTKTKHLFVLNIINPGVVYEYSISDNSTISANLGYGISMSYPELTDAQPNHALFFAPFFDVQYKYIYNRDKRIKQNKSVLYNSGNLMGVKLVGRGDNYGNGLERTDNVDFAVGPTWGVQRNVKKFLLNFNLGPQFYMDTKGNFGFYPIMLELNIGYVLNR